MKRPGVIGVGVGAADGVNEAAIIVYIDANARSQQDCRRRSTA